MIEKYVAAFTLTTRIDYSLNQDVFDKKQESGCSMRTDTDSKESVFKWKENMNEEDIVKIQQNYKLPIRLLSYILSLLLPLFS